MEFRVRPINYEQTEVSLRYMMPNGSEKVISQTVNSFYMRNTDAISQRAYADLMGLVKNSLKRMAEEDITEFVRQNAQEGNMAPLYNTNPYIQQFNQQYVGTSCCDEPLCDDVTTSTVEYSQYWRQTCSSELTAWNYCIPNRRIVKISYKDGRRTLTIEKEAADEIIITPEDIEKAKMEYWKNAKINIIVRKAETKAEALLKMFISEVDFRNYKEKGFFTVKSGNRIFRIHKDTHKYIDMYEREGEVFVPRNRLCVHTPTRELPKADEALAKLLLIRNNSVIEHSNLHDTYGLRPVREMEELLV